MRLTEDEVKRKWQAAGNESDQRSKWSDVEIRLAGPADVAGVATLLYKSFLEYEALYTQEAFSVTVSTPEQIQARLIEGPVWVALENETVVGTVSAVLKDQELYIRSIAVDPSMRGKRIGRKLLDCAEEFAVHNRCKRLFLSTTPFLSRAIKLYEHYGFRRNDAGPHNLFGTPLFTMEKPLHALALRKTEKRDLDYVLAAEHSEENRVFLIPWSRAQHLQALADSDLAHSIVQAHSRVGYVILAGLRNPNRSIELRRIVVTEKDRGYGKAAVKMIKDLAFKTHRAHRLWLDVKVQNERARGLYEAAGFLVEGTLRECLHTENGFESLVVMSMLRQEYQNLGY